MKVLNICQSDWSNFSEDNARAFREVGVKCVSLKEKAHMFKYNHESRVATTNEILVAVKEADVVQIMHSDAKMLNLCRMATKKKVVVYHTGTGYRKEPDKMNALFNQYVSMCFTDQCEFMELGAKGVQYIATAVDTKKIRPEKNVYGPYQVAHYPSCSKTKGSDVIVKTVSDIYESVPTFGFHYAENRLSHAEQLHRMQSCDIYIELFAPDQDGKPYGCFGVTAFEAAAMGKVVITQNIFENVYQDVYGSCALVICNTKKDLEAKIRELLQKTPKEIVSLQKSTRAWVEENHSYAATGARLKKILESI